MALHPSTGAPSLERLGPDDLIETFAFLDRDPVLHVYLLALVLRDRLAPPRDEFWCARRDGSLAAILYLGGASGAVLPAGDDDDALALLARQAVARRAFLPRRFQIIGPERALAAFVAAFRDAGIAARLVRRQRYMQLVPERFVEPQREPALRPARPEDFDMVFHSGADLRAEELEEDPRSTDPIAYARRVEDECRDGYTWIAADAGGLQFRASVSALTADAAQISGVYVPPSRRNHGHARRGLAELCARLFERSRAVCLFVNDFNAPAIAVYERLGFCDHAAWGSAFYDAPLPAAADPGERDA
jgi:RimJ/RimL family protein N-acetyltransferase